MKPTKAPKKAGKATKERAQGVVGPSGINTPVKKPAQKTYKPGGTYTRPDQKQKV